MTLPITVGGLRIDHSVWLALALESAAETQGHWPNCRHGIPPIIREKLAEFRIAAERLREDADLLATLLAGEGCEAVEGMVFEDVEACDDERADGFDGL